MKTQFTLLLVFFLNLVIAQQHGSIRFDFDSAGNQVKRYINLGNRQSNSNAIADEDLTEADLTADALFNDLKYYPNPVLETLYIKWTISETVAVNNMVVYNVNGQELGRYEGLQSLENYSVPFGSYPSGYYVIVLNYTNGVKKDLKIVKR